MSDVDEIKSRVNIIDIINPRVTLKKAGRNFKGLCPFHNEKTASFMVSPERGTWHCFGCGKGGSVFDFVMEYEHIDFAEALEELAEKAGVTLTRRADVSPEGKLKQRIFEANHLAGEFYQYLLTKHTLGKKALSYVTNRGASEKIIKTFMLGYSPNSWDALMKFLKKKGYDEYLLEKAGLIIRSQRGNGYYDRFRGRLMFALCDHRGNVVGFSGRLLDPDAKEAKYINTSETPVYSKSNVLYALNVTKDAISKKNEAVIMEGEFDVISSFQAGISNVVAIKGSALTEGHVNLLRRFCERIIFALDSDMAGDAAARRGIAIADKGGLDMKVALLSGGKDPDDVAREHPALLKTVLADAVPVYDYFISSAIKRFDGTSAFGKKKISEELLPVIASIDNAIVQNHYVKKLATAIDVSEELIEEGLRKQRLPVSSPTGAADVSVGQSREEKLEIFILSLLFSGKTAELFEDVKEIIGEFTYKPVVQILQRLQQFLSATPVFLIKDFIDSLPQELVPTVDQVLLWDLGDIADSEDLLVKEWNKAIEERARMAIWDGIARLTKKIKEAGSEEEREAFQKEQQLLVARRSALEKGEKS